MQIHFFRIPVNDPHEAEQELNRFLASRKILTTQREFIADGQYSFWAIAVEYLHSSSSGIKEPVNKRRKDYKKELTPEAFVLFSRLREWRKGVAEQLGIPLYTVFTNEQLAQIASVPVTTLDDLIKIEGVGQARAEKFGSIVEMVRREAGNNETAGKPLPEDS